MVHRAENPQCKFRYQIIYADIGRLALLVCFIGLQGRKPWMHIHNQNIHADIGHLALLICFLVYFVDVFYGLQSRISQMQGQISNMGYIADMRQCP